MEYVPFQYERARQELALALMLAGAVLTKESNHPLVVTRKNERGFLFKHHEKEPGAPLAPIYFNIRTADNPKPGPITQELVEKIARCIQYLVSMQRIIYDGVAGFPYAGDPIAQEFSKLMGKPLVSLDKWEFEGKRHIASPKERIPLHVGKILMLDDVAMKCLTKKEGITVMRSDEGKWVNDVAVLIDYELGGREELGFHGCSLHSVFTASELLDIYVKTGQMRPAIRDEFRELLLAA